MELIPAYSPSENTVSCPTCSGSGTVIPSVFPSAQQFATKFTENLGVALATVLQAEKVASEGGAVLKDVRLCVSKKLASQKGG